MKLLKIPVIAICSALFFISCGSNSTDSKEVAENTNDEKFDDSKDMKKDADALLEAYSGSLMEVRLSEQMLPKFVTTEAKKLAEIMIVAHQKANVQIKELASKKQITLPADLSDDDKNKINKMLDEHKGVDLDKRYANEMIDGHKSMIGKFETNADKCEDPDIKGLFSSMLPDLRSHLQTAEETKDVIKDMKK